MDLESGEWIIDDINDGCVDCSQPRGINLDTGDIKCFTPLCMASAEFSLDDAVDFLGEHFQVVVIK
jgi:hypothetical protein|tara:strand:+ start:3669 stop:3866 length:198 start_codon:yes stop_codon:yes gene_type:complete